MEVTELTGYVWRVIWIGRSNKRENHKEKIISLEGFISTYEKFVSGDVNPNEGIIIDLENE